MQNFIVKQAKKLMGKLQVPGDKSISHRALMLATIVDGRSIVNVLLMGADNLATMHALQQLGVSIKQTDQQQLTYRWRWFAWFFVENDSLFNIALIFTCYSIDQNIESKTRGIK